MKIIKYIITLAVLFYLFYDIDISTVIGYFSSYTLEGIAILFGIYLISFLVLAMRWKFLSKNLCDLKPSLESVVLCIGINNITPVKIGELAKIFYLKERVNYPVSKSFVLMLIERLFDLIILSFLLLLSSFYFDILNSYAVIFVSSVLFSLLIFILYKPKIILKIIYKKTSKRKAKFFSSMLKTVTRFSSYEWLVISTYSILLWVVYFMTSYYFVIFQTCFNLTVFQILIVFIGGAIGMAIPSTPGGLGVVQAGYIVGLTLFGISKEEAMSFAVVIHMVQYIPTTVIAIVLINTRGFKLDKIKLKIKGEKHF